MDACGGRRTPVCGPVWTEEQCTVRDDNGGPVLINFGKKWKTTSKHNTGVRTDKTSAGTTGIGNMTKR